MTEAELEEFTRDRVRDVIASVRVSAAKTWLASMRLASAELGQDFPATDEGFFALHPGQEWPRSYLEIAPPACEELEALVVAAFQHQLDEMRAVVEIARGL